VELTPMTVTTRPLTEDHGTRSRLVAAAAELVHAESYHAVGVKAICDRARVRRGSFYHFFDSKQALVLEAVEKIWEEFSREVLEVCRDRTLGPQARLEAMVDRIHRRHLRDRDRTGSVLGCCFGNLTAEATTLDEAIRQRLVRVFDDWAAALEAPLTDAQQLGEIDREATPRAIALEMISELQGLILMAKARNEPAVISSGGRNMIARLWGAGPHTRPHAGADRTPKEPA
jgi:TetR/AcrR family transcriptional repressor of nem operon